MDAPIISIPDNPTPQGASARWLTLPEGIRLRSVDWTAQAAGIARPRGTVFMFNGRAEFSEKYFEVIGELTSRGFAAATLDWRGQGLSSRLLDDPRKGHVDDFLSYGRDLNFFMQELAPSLPRPYIVLAHSMGSHILLRAAHDRPELFDAMVLNTPMLGLRLGGPIARAGLRALASTLVKFGAGHRYVPGGTDKAIDAIPFEENILTSDPVRYACVVELVRTKPLLGLGAPSLSWINAAFRSMEITEDPAYLEKIKLPLLVTGTSSDRLLDNDMARRAVGLMPQADYVEIAGARHEILMERDQFRAQFWRAFDGFTARFSA